MALLEQKGYTYSKQPNIGSKLLISNGYLGYRGTLDEADSSDLVALNLNGLYDGNVEYESVNAYNPLYIMLKADGINLNPKSFRPKKHIVSLNTETGVFRRQTDFKYGNIEVTIKSERFVDQIDKNLMYSKFTFKSSKEIEAEIYSGIDTSIWNINDIHLKRSKMEKSEEMIIIHSKIKRSNLDIFVGVMEEYSFKANDTHKTKSISKYKIKLIPGKEYNIIKYAGVIHSDSLGKENLIEKLQNAKKMGYKKLLKRNIEFWNKVYEISRIHIFNNDKVKEQADYAVYQLISHRPYSDNTSIPLKGLSGQYNQGGISWQTEVFLLPFYINVDTVSARHMIMYRIKGLEESIRRTKEYGYLGALYPVLSGYSGKEIDSREIKNMIHVNGSIIYGIYQYVEQTGDYSVLFEGALEMMLEMCRFYISYATLSDNKKHYDFLNVYGLDYTHGDVNNEAYTNQVIKFALDSLIKSVAFAKQTDKAEVKKIFDEHGYDDLIKEIRELRRRLYTKKENIEYLVESFDDYYDLEDKKISRLKKAKYIEKMKGISFDRTSYIKNSNVLVMLALFSEEFPNIVHRKSYDYYIRRSVQPDIFAKIMYILEACEIDLVEDAYEMFEELANLDISNNNLFKDGLNLVLLGGIYITLVYGFAGVKRYTYLVSCDYNIPNKISRIECTLRVMDNIAYVKVKRNSANVKWTEFEEDED